MVPPVANTWKLLDYFKDILFTVVNSGHIGFDIFFFILAFFDFYHFELLYQREGGFSGLTYLRLLYKRFIRIAPVYYIVFFAGWLIGPFMQSGPAWFTYSSLYYECDKYWWANVLFIGNLYPGFQMATEGCFYWSAFI